MAEQIAQVVTAYQQQWTSHEPDSVSVVLSGETVLVTQNGALPPTDHATAQSQEDAAKVQESLGQFFVDAGDTLRQEIKRITGMEVREATAVVQVFTSGTIVQVFLLSGKVPFGVFNQGCANEQRHSDKADVSTDRDPGKRNKSP